MKDKPHPNELFTNVATRPNTPPEYPTQVGEFNPFRVWCWRCFADGWICIATFADKSDALDFISHQTGRVSGIYLQTPTGTEHYRAEIR